MIIAEIQGLPTHVDEILKESTGIHESTLRAYQILSNVKEWLEKGVPSDVILELISEMENYGVEIKSHRGALSWVFTGTTKTKE